MNFRGKLLTRLTATVALSSVAIATAVAQTQLSHQSKLVINGIAAVRVGMTVPQASQAAGTKLVNTGSFPGTSCHYVNPQAGLKGLSFMVTDGRIARVDIFKGSPITTLRGARIGDTEARIKGLYPGQIQVSPHQYVPGGHYLTFVPKDRADRNYRVVFETDGKRVTAMRSGKLPEVEYVEGCS